MISETEIIHIINELHVDDLVLVELRDGAIFGILKGARSPPTYFRARATGRTANARRALLDEANRPQEEGHVDSITLETLLNGLKGMKVRHVWLERRIGRPHEMAFLNFRELAHYLRRHEV